MTPEEANELLEVLEEDFYVSEDGYWNLLEQVADMAWEYGVQDANGEIVWSVEDHFVDGDSRADAAEYLATFEPGQAKLVRRMVSEPEVTE